MWDCPFDWYHFYNIELQQITAKIMVTRQTIRQPRKTVQQDQVELRTGQWTAFVKTQFWRLGNRTTSKIDGSSRDSGSMIRFDSFNFLWTVHFRQRYVILDRSFPPRPHCALLKMKIKQIRTKNNQFFKISKPSPAEFRSEIPNIFTKIVQTIKFGPNPVSKTTEIAKNMHVKNLRFGPQIFAMDLNRIYEFFLERFYHCWICLSHFSNFSAFIIVKMIS